MKKIAICFALILVLVFSGCAEKKSALVVQDQADQKAVIETTDQSATTASSTLTASTTPDLGQDLGALSIPNDEFFATSSGAIKKKFLLYAEKIGRTVFFKKKIWPMAGSRRFIKLRSLPAVLRNRGICGSLCYLGWPCLLTEKRLPLPTREA